MKAPKNKYAWTVKVGEKGQIVIPKEARTLFDIDPGDTLLLLGDKKKGLAIVPQQFYNGILSKLATMLGEEGSKMDGKSDSTEGAENP